MNGFLSVLKPPGMSSGMVVARVRHLLPKGTRVGHAGTLDPAAAGVLPVMIGRATRLFDYTTDKAKTYLVEFIPGFETDTQDYTGTVLNRLDCSVDRERIEAKLGLFLGDISQVPPMYSALKRNGVRLYEMARAGETVQLEPRTVHIDRIEIAFEERGHFFLEVTCGRGTYMRTLCHDLGLALGTYGCMGTLIRTASGPFVIQDSVTLEMLSDVNPEQFLYPMDTPLMHLPALDASELIDERHLRSGVPVPCRNVQVPEGVPLRVYWKNRFCGIAHRRGSGCTFDCLLLE